MTLQKGIRRISITIAAGCLIAGFWHWLHSKEQSAQESRTAETTTSSSLPACQGDGIAYATTAAPVATEDKNLLGIKFVPGKFKNFGATNSGRAAGDGGTYVRFPNPEQGLAAAKELLQSPTYNNLAVEAALRKWSNGGYGAEIVTGSIQPDDKISSLTEEQLDLLIAKMATRETGSRIGADSKLPIKLDDLTNWSGASFTIQAHHCFTEVAMPMDPSWHDWKYEDVGNNDPDAWYIVWPAGRMPTGQITRSMPPPNFDRAPRFKIATSRDIYFKFSRVKQENLD